MIKSDNPDEFSGRRWRVLWRIWRRWRILRRSWKTLQAQVNKTISHFLLHWEIMTVATSVDSLLEKLKREELYLPPSNWESLHSQGCQFPPPTRASPPSSFFVSVSSPFTLFMFVCVETWALHFAWVARIGNLIGNDLGKKKYQFYWFEFSTRCTVLSYDENSFLGKITMWCSQISILSN